MSEKLKLNYRLFPFDKIKKDSQVVLYGDKEILKDFDDQLVSTNYVKIIAKVERNRIDPTKSRKVYVNTDTFVVVGNVSYQDVQKIRKELEYLNLDKSHIIFSDYQIDKTPDIVKLDGFSWNEYYEQAESFAKEQFYLHINPYIKEENINLDHVLDFGCGRGRMSEILGGIASRVVCSDTNEEAIEYCKQRFSPFVTNCQFEFILNTQIDKPKGNIQLLDGEIDFILSWDTLVHFDYKWMDRYMKEFYRVLKPGGYAAIHYSNLGGLKSYRASSLWIINQAGRSNVTGVDAKFIAENHGFKVLKQKAVHGTMKDMDGVMLVRKG